MSKPYIHPESQTLLEVLSAGTPLDEQDLADARRGAEETFKQLAGDAEFQGEEREILIPGTAKDVPVTVYTPHELKKSPAILIYFHGGGWTVCSRKTHEQTCKALAQLCGCIVGNVEYRLSPEEKTPASYEDAKSVLEWVMKDKTQIGGDEGSRVGVIGDSAGGSISAVVSYEVPGIDFQILVYPVTDFRRKSESYELFADGYFLTAKLMDWFAEQTLEKPEDEQNPRWTVVRRTDAEVARLPPALFIVAPLDPLRDDSFEYEKLLKRNGVSTDMLVVDGAIHTFFQCPGHCKELSGKAFSKVQEFVSKF